MARAWKPLIRAVLGFSQILEETYHKREQKSTHVRRNIPFHKMVSKYSYCLWIVSALLKCGSFMPAHFCITLFNYYHSHGFISVFILQYQSFTFAFYEVLGVQSSGEKEKWADKKFQMNSKSYWDIIKSERFLLYIPVAPDCSKDCSAINYCTNLHKSMHHHSLFFSRLCSFRLVLFSSKLSSCVLKEKQKQNKFFNCCKVHIIRLQSKTTYSSEYVKVACRWGAIIYL